MYTPDSPILGPARVSQERVISVLLSRKPTPLYTEHDFRTGIVLPYFEVCALTGVDPVVAIAQCVHETGNFTSWWSQRPRRNPAGLGVTGKTRASRPEDITQWAYDPVAKIWKHGLSFATWSSAVEAHVGRLVAYAVHGSDYTEAQRYYANLALAYRPLPTRFLGCAPTLKGLGGTWAFPGFTYAAKLATHANRFI